MRLKPGSTIVVPRTDDDDEDISADVAENGVLAMEPDVPDTRKMLIRVRRKQSMEALASRYGVSVAQLRGWNRTRRAVVMPGQTMVLHVPVGRAVPAEPGPERIATSVGGGRIERASLHTGGKASSRGRKAGPAAKASAKAATKSGAKAAPAKTAGRKTTKKK